MKEFGKVPGLGLLFLRRMQTSSVPLRPTSPVWSRRTETNKAVLTSVLHIKKKKSPYKTPRTVECSQRLQGEALNAAQKCYVPITGAA